MSVGVDATREFPCIEADVIVCFSNPHWHADRPATDILQSRHIGHGDGVGRPKLVGALFVAFDAARIEELWCR